MQDGTGVIFGNGKIKLQSGVADPVTVQRKSDSQGYHQPYIPPPPLLQKLLQSYLHRGADPQKIWKFQVKDSQRIPRSEGHTDAWKFHHFGWLRKCLHMQIYSEFIFGCLSKVKKYINANV